MLKEIEKAITNLTNAMLIRMKDEKKMKEWGYETIHVLAKEIITLVDIYDDVEGEEMYDKEQINNNKN